MNTITVKSIIDTSKSYQYVDDGNPKRGGVKDVYFSPDRRYVVAFFRDPLDFNQKERIKRIVSLYLENIKKGKWFTTPSFRDPQYPLCLAPSELGDWLSYFQIAINICRGIKKMHQMGLAHSDLSYNNILIDPVTKSANIIDLDGLVVPGMFPPEVIGTADFIAPEVLSTKHLDIKDPKRALPNQKTDLHALAVLIYMYLLRRHPLKGSKVWDLDAEKDELLAMGEKALFIEHPTDTTNRVKPDQLRKWDAFWGDPAKLPYTVTGPYLTELFNRAFIDGLHNPMLRPIANEWETALLKTVDLIQPCSNPSCTQKWYVFDNTARPKCPFCGTPHRGSLPIADLYYNAGNNVWKPENHRLMVYHNQFLFKWHVSRKLIRNENLTNDDKRPVGYFTFYQNRWVLVNQSLPDMKDVTENKPIPIGTMVELTNEKKIILSNDEGGRLLYITLVN